MARPDLKKIFKKGRSSSKMLPEQISTNRADPEDPTLLVCESMAEHTHGAGWPDRRGGAYAPLRRFIASNVGREWNFVWADICKWCDERTHDGRATRKAAEGMVVTDTIRRDGKIYDKQASRRYNACLSDPTTYYPSLYVDPEGVLREQPRVARPKRASLVADELARNGIVPVTDSIKLQKLNGIWYMIEYRMIDDPLAPVSMYSFGRRPDKIEIVDSKRQLNTDELRMHKLKNDVPKVPTTRARQRRR